MLDHVFCVNFFLKNRYLYLKRTKHKNLHLVSVGRCCGNRVLACGSRCGTFFLVAMEGRAVEQSERLQLLLVALKLIVHLVPYPATIM